MEGKVHTFVTAVAPDRTMARCIDEYNWASTPLGEIKTWPHALRVTVSTMLASKIPIYITWGSSRISLYNDAFLPILAGKHPQALGATFDDVWQELAAVLKNWVDLAYQDQTSYAEDLPVTILRNGKIEQASFTFSYSGIRGDSGEVEGLYCVCIETTEGVVAREQRKNQNERLLTLFQQAPGFMAVLRGPQHIFEIANDAYYALVGHRDIIGKSVAEGLHEAAAQGFVTLLDEVYSSGKSYVGNAVKFDLIRGSESRLEENYVDFIYQPLFDKSKRVTGIFVQGHDVTKAHLAQQALLVADAQKDSFIATLAHELRNPLAPIRSAATLVSSPAITPVMLAKSAEIIERQVGHMAKLLDDLLDVARIARNQITLVKERVTIDELVAMAVETAEPISRKKHQTINVQFQENIELNVDKVRVSQVIANLICNAAKYTDHGGKITVVARREAGECVVSVIDNGIGIQPEALTSIFDIFTQQTDVITRSEGGLGIGLSIVKGLVDLHEGRVTAHSEGKQKGSTFTVFLPCLPNGESHKDKQQNILTGFVLGPKKILLADDNIDAVDTLSDLLTIYGHETCIARTGFEALELFRSKRPDVAILDIGMPGMSGYEIAKAIRNDEEVETFF